MSDEQQSTELVPSEPSMVPRALGAVDEWQATAKQVLTTIRTDTNEGRTAYLRCVTASDKELQRCVGDKLRVKEWLIHQVDRVNRKTGEVRLGLRLVLLLEDGRTVSTGSDSFIDGWGHVYRLFRGQEKWPMLEVEILGPKNSDNSGIYLVMGAVSVIPETTAAKRTK